jgi:hypothetical protein
MLRLPAVVIVDVAGWMKAQKQNVLVQSAIHWDVDARYGQNPP